MTAKAPETATTSATARALELFALDGRSAIVTGAGRGIGHAIAKLLAEAGARVLVADIDGATARESAAVINDAAGSTLATPFTVDVSDKASVDAMVAAGIASGGRLDVLVNNAGIFPKTDFLELTVERWDLIQAVNLRGVFLCMQSAIAAMKTDGKGGSIVNISSVSSLRAAVFANQAYGASKAGVSNLTRSCAAEFAPDRIRINAVLPGGVLTAGAREATTQSGIKVAGPITGPGRVPLGRPGVELDIAKAVLFFASDASDYITGQLLAVDGGFCVS